MPPFHPHISIAKAATIDRARGPSRSTYARDPAVVPLPVADASSPSKDAKTRVRGRAARRRPGRAPARSGRRPRRRRRRRPAPRARCRGGRPPPRTRRRAPAGRRSRSCRGRRGARRLTGSHLVEPGGPELGGHVLRRRPRRAATPTDAGRARPGPRRGGGRPRRRSRRRAARGSRRPIGGGIIAPARWRAVGNVLDSAGTPEVQAENERSLSTSVVVLSLALAAPAGAGRAAGPGRGRGQGRQAGDRPLRRRSSGSTGPR